MTRAGIVATIGWAAVVVLTGGATAMDQDADYAEFGLEELLGMDVVYGASTYEQRISQAPSAVLVITADEIETYGFRTLGDLLDTVAGYYTTSDRVYRYVGIRGFNRLGDYGSRLLVLVDGHRINDNIYQTGTVGPEFPIDVELIKRVEIVRGPSSSLYGSNAFFGVVNIVTRDARDVEGVEVAAGLSSFDGYDGRFTVGTKASSPWQVLASASYRQAAGDDIYYPEFDDPATNDGVFAGGDGDEARRAFACVERGPFTLHAAWSRRDKHVPTAAWGTVFNDPTTRARDQRAYADLAWEGATGATSRLHVRGYYDDYQYSGWYAYEDVVNRDHAEGRWLGLDTRWTADIGGRHRLVAGAELRHNLRGLQQNFDEGAAEMYLDRDETSSELGLAIQDDIALGRGWTLNAGLRHDRYDEFDATNPRLALIAEPRDGTVLKGLYATAFRAPSIYERYYDDGGSSQKANPELDPETITSFEFVWEQQLSARVASTVSVFHYDVEDLITLVVDPADDLLVLENLDQATASGLEVGVDARMLPGVHGRASYSYQSSEDDRTGATLTNSPQHLAKLNLHAPLLDSRAAVALQVQYMSVRQTLQAHEAASHATADLTVLWRAHAQRLTVSLSAYNLFDAEYGDPASAELQQDLVPREGRTYNLKATVNF